MTSADPVSMDHADLPSRLLAALAVCETLPDFDRLALDAVADAAGAKRVALWRPTLPDWTPLASRPAIRGGSPPSAVIEALDSEATAEAQGWSAINFAPAEGTRQGDVLAIEASIDAAMLVELAALYAAARGIVQRTTQARQRAERADELLTISLAWSETNDTVALLEQMAEAASRLFGADRATIFLWDRAASQLVGRPALGLPDNRLVIGDDVGVVGRVVQSGEALRVSASNAKEEQVDRTTDATTGYQTESLVCVPLDAPSGERLGAFELLNKKQGDFSADDEQGLAEFARFAAVALANAQQVEELIERRDTLIEEAASGVQMLGNSPPIVALRSTIARVANADLAVLVLGENGTGKEVVAQSLHFQSSRRAEPLVAVNCAAIAETLLESELFGHEAGAFTGANESRAGKFELADGGTLLLDEIGDMSLAGQSKLLRVLEDKMVVRVGGSEGRKVDVRVVAATNCDLLERVREKRFREDLYYRLNVVSLELPPLRDRGEDVLLLGEHFLQAFCKTRGRKPPRFSADARRRLLAHPWPGNVRELRNLMERIAFLTDDSLIQPDDLGLIAPTGDDADLLLDLTLAGATQQFQRDHIARAVDRARGNVSAAARKLGMHRSNLYRKMDQLDMSVDEED